MTEAQQRAYNEGWTDRAAKKEMRDVFTPGDHVANAYTAGFRDAGFGVPFRPRVAVR